MVGERIRIADVVARTGLSRSTVDRVLNGRAGVKAETRELVKTALFDLGYSKSTLEFLSQHRSKSLHAILPEGSNPFFAELRRGVETAAGELAHFGGSLSYQFFDPYDPLTLSDRLDRIDGPMDAVITLGVDCPEATRRIDALADGGTPVVTIVSDAPYSRRSIYIGQDNFAAGRTAARLMSALLPEASGSVAVILGHLEFRHLLERQSGFQQVMGQVRPEVRLIHTRPYGAHADGGPIIEELFANAADLAGIYIAGGGQPAVLRALSRMAGDLAVIGHELNPVTREALTSGLYSAVICNDVHELGQKAISAALGLKDRSATACSINIYLPDNLPPA